MTVPNLTLSADVDIPQLGFGVFKIPDAETQAAVTCALEVGYRHIDTARIYGNEAAVGAAVRSSGLARDEVFVTTKVWNDDQGADAARRAAHASAARLDLGVIDLLLIHWPAPARDSYVETWRSLTKLRAEGLVRAIGVSNFTVEHLQRLIDETGEIPSINQIELHPELPQTELRAFHAAHGILTEAWSPLARAGSVFGSPVITSIAERVGRTPAQVILRWHIELGNVVIPKSVTPARIAENFALFDFSLTPDDHAAIATLEKPNGAGRIGPDPVRFS